MRVKRVRLSLGIVLLLIGGGFVIFGIITGDLPAAVSKYFSASVSIQKNQNGTSSESQGTDNKIYSPTYSFSQDDDADGLSNAKEIIYSADPQNKDTDGDGYLDGEEVKQGFDPTREGSIRLDKRSGENLTIRYFSWAQQKTGNADPRLTTELVNEFIATQTNTSLDTVTLADSDITIIAPEDEYDALLAYFGELGSVPIPTVASSYFDVAKEAVNDNFENVNKITSQLAVIEGQLRSMKTPKTAATLQKKYVELVVHLERLFGDLYKVKTDPVLLGVNLEKGGKLLPFITDMEKLTKDMLSKYQISPKDIPPRTPTSTQPLSY